MRTRRNQYVHHYSSVRHGIAGINNYKKANSDASKKQGMYFLKQFIMKSKMKCTGFSTTYKTFQKK